MLGIHICPASLAVMQSELAVDGCWSKIEIVAAEIPPSQNENQRMRSNGYDKQVIVRKEGY